jgi:hypothetical protein
MNTTRGRSSKAVLRPYNSIRSAVIVLAIVFVGSMLTFHVDSQRGGAAPSQVRKAVTFATPAPAQPASVKAQRPAPTPMVGGGGGIGSVGEADAPAATPLFLAGVEQFGLGSGQIDLFNVTLGGNTAGSDTFAVGSPATLATTNSTNENKPDINNPVDIRFDKSGDLLIANGGTSNADPGSFACVPAGAVTTGANSSTTITQAGTNPIAFGYLAYDARDGSAAIANNPVSSSTQLFEYILSGSYSAAGSPRNLIAPGFGAVSVTEVPALAAGTYAVALQKGVEEDPAHGGTVGSNKVALFSPTGVETDIADDTNFSIDEPYGLAFDSQNNQLVIANNSVWHKLLSFYTVSPVSLVKTINTGFKNTYTATSPDGHVAVAWVKQFGYMQVQVYDNTAARNPVFGPIPYNGTTTSCGSTYIYGNGTAIVNGMRWLSNTKLLVAVESNNSGTPTAKNGFYIYDITNSEVPAGFDDITCSAFAAAPINTGFVHVNTHPFGVAVRSGTFVFADPAGSCGGNTPCFTSINSAIANVAGGGVVNVFGGTYNEAVTLNNANVTLNIDGNTTVHAFTLTAGILNAGAGSCGQAGSFTLTLDTGNWTNNGGTFNAGSGTVAFSGTGAQSITGSNQTTFNNLTINSTNTVTPAVNTSVTGDLNVTSGTFDLQGFTASRTTSGGTLTVSNGATLKIGGSNTLPTNYGTYTLGTTSTVEYEGAGTQTIAAVNYGNLTSSNTGARTLASSGTIGIAGTFTIGTNAYTTTGSTVNFNGSGAQTIPALNYNNLTSSNGGARTLASLGTIGIAGAFTTGGSAYTTSGSTVNFNGGSLQSIPAFTFNNLTLANAAGANLGGSVTVNGTLGLANGTLGVGSQTLTLLGSVSPTTGSLTSAAAGTVNYTQTSDGQAVIAANYGNLTFSNFKKTLPNGSTIGIAGTFTPGSATGHTTTGSTVNFNGSSLQTIPAFTFNNLTLSNSSGANLGGAVTVGATLSLANGALNVGSQTLTLNGGVAVTSGTLTSGASGTVAYNQQSDGQSVLAGNYGNLTFSNFKKTLPGSGTVGIAGVFTPGSATGHTTTGSTVEYNGSSAQTLPSAFTTYNNLTLNNAAGTTGFDGLTVQGLLEVKAGTFTSGSAAFKDIQIDNGKTFAATGSSTLSVSGNWTNNTGTFTANSSTVNFNGSSTQTVGGTTATTFNNLTNSNTAGLTLGANETVGGVLALTSSDITTGANTLTQPAAGSSTGSFDVVGNLKRIFPAGLNNTLSFGNPNNQITINSGTAPTDITVNLVKAVPSGGIAFPTAVQRTYTITPTGGSGISATVRLHYQDGELNGNTEAGLGLWRFASSVWARQGATNSDTTADWVELSGVTQFSPWTLASAKNNSTTSNVTATPNPSNVGQAVTVNFSVVSAVTGAPTPTGNVTVSVNDASNDTCTGTVASGTCQLTLTTPGNNKTLTATYAGDSNFNTSLGTTTHTVNQILISALDAKAFQPQSGTSPMLFTVSLSIPAGAGGVSVNYATADQSAGTGHAVGGASCDGTADYQTASGTLNFASGESVKTVAVMVCGETNRSEPDETFLLNLSGGVGGQINRTTATGTITQTNTPGTFLISELRTSGPGGLGDDFVELYNNTDTPLTVTASDASAGYGLFKKGADCNSTPVLIATIPNGTVIPARGHYLLVGSQYSLANYGGTGAAAGDQTLTSDIESDAGVALFTTSNVLNISTADRLDAVGFGNNTGGICDLLREGSTLPPVSGTTADHSFFRKECDFQAGVGCTVQGTPKDTNDNSSDFEFADTQGTNISGVPRQLGAPGPENKTSPIRRDSTILVSLLDNTDSSAATPNRVRDVNATGTNAAFGTLSIRRRVTNQTGANVTRLRFRIVEVTTFPSPGAGVAELRALSSADVSGGVMVNDAGTCSPSSAPCTVVVRGTSLEQPPTQSGGGGVNSTLAVGVVSLAQPLAPNAAVNVQFLLGVQQTGAFRFLIITEALP